MPVKKPPMQEDFAEFLILPQEGGSGHAPRKRRFPRRRGENPAKNAAFPPDRYLFQRGLRLSRRPAVPPLASPPRCNAVCANRRRLLLPEGKTVFPSRRLRLQTAAAYAGRPWAANSFSRPPLRKSDAAPRGAEAGRRGNPNPRGA